MTPDGPPPTLVKRLTTADGELLSVLPDGPVRGGEAAVYAAISADGARLAVKVALLPGAGGAWLDEERRRIEAFGSGPAAAWVVPVLAHGLWDGRAWFAMPWEPLTLEAFTARRPSVAERREVCKSLCDALINVQRADPTFVHRDLKPSNVFVGDGGRVRLGDFGAARTRLTGATTTTLALFTPGFAPPEQTIPGPQRPIPAWDAYALAATVWFVLVGERLGAAGHNARCLTEVGHRAVSGREQADPARCFAWAEMVDLLPADERLWAERVGDPRLLRAMRRLLAPDPRRRAGSAADLRRAFEAPDRRVAIGVAALGLAAVAVAAVAMSRGVAPAGPVVEVVRVPAGTYEVGALEHGPGRSPWDEPVHEVHLDDDVWIGRAEVTQALWNKVTGEDAPSDRRYTHEGTVDSWCGAFAGVSLVGADLPVVCVTWLESIRFANALSARAGLEPAYTIPERAVPDDVIWDPSASGWRLPTGAEWEIAARAGRRVDGEGDDLDEGSCAWRNVSDASWLKAYGQPTHELAHCTDGYAALGPAVSLRPNPWGVYGMGGNASEWVWDAHVAGRREFRGSNFHASPRYAGYSTVHPGKPDHRWVSVGLRLARNGP